MGIFSLGRKPRCFSHVPIFYDERDGRLGVLERKTEQGSREEEGREPSETIGQGSGDAYHREALRGAFVQETSHLRRHREHAGSWVSNMGALFLIVLVLVLAFAFLMV